MKQLFLLPICCLSLAGCGGSSLKTPTEPKEIVINHLKNYGYFVDSCHCVYWNYGGYIVDGQKQGESFFQLSYYPDGDAFSLIHREGLNYKTNIVVSFYWGMFSNGSFMGSCINENGAACVIELTNIQLNTYPSFIYGGYTVIEADESEYKVKDGVAEKVAQGIKYAIDCFASIWDTEETKHVTLW